MINTTKKNELLTFIKSLTSDQVDKIIIRLPELISLCSEEVQYSGEYHKTRE